MAEPADEKVQALLGSSFSGEEVQPRDRGVWSVVSAQMAFMRSITAH